MCKNCTRTVSRTRCPSPTSTSCCHAAVRCVCASPLDVLKAQAPERATLKTLTQQRAMTGARTQTRNTHAAAKTLLERLKNEKNSSFSRRHSQTPATPAKALFVSLCGIAKACLRALRLVRTHSRREGGGSPCVIKSAARVAPLLPQVLLERQAAARLRALTPRPARRNGGLLALAPPSSSLP